MAGTASEDFAVGRSFEGGSSAQQRSQANSEALAEWRSSEQVENGSPSTSLPYWDSDDDDDDHGPKPSQLYYKYTWKIEKFSQINKRELKSNVFDVGGYKWYILIYPQGCDVSNHLSLFLCVANHEKLLPGWSHFAQFTIAVVNKDPKKSKYSDTLHRFWKKEHDWGWKKFMELAKVSDGFLDADTLIIKAQVQVIRERVDRPFRCLDFQYRRELVRVYLTNIEQICRRFVEEKRCKLGKLLEDKARWSSFCAFWLGIDQNARWRMSREKTDSLLKVVVKHFFVEKEVTSTLVMDSLFSGLKALEGETQTKQGGLKNLESVELSGPIVFMEKDTFILADDVLLLLERAATEPLPPKDDKGAQNRTKDGGSGEDFSKDSIERDERRLTELGRKTIEIFVLAHIFSSKIEVAYQEAVALKRQEELIREEEASWIAESEQKSKRGVADKDKKSKKKQGKHKRNSHKVKEKGKNEKPDVVVEDEPKPEIHDDRRNQFLLEEVDPIGNPNPEEDVSDMSDSINAVPELLHPDSEDRDSSPVWDTDASEAILLTESSSSGITGFLGVENRDRKSSFMMDDSSSTCSTDSLPSVTTMNGTSQVDSFQKQKSQDTPRRGNQQGRMTPEATGLAFDACSKRSDAFSDGRQLHDVSESSKAAEFGGAVVHLLQQHAEGPVVKHVTKEEKDYTLQRKLTVTEGINADKTAELKTTGIPSSPKSPPKNLPYAVQLRSELKHTATSNTILITKSSSESPTRADKTASANSTETTVLSNAYAQKTASPKPVVKSTALPVPISTANSMALAVPTSTANSMALHVPISTTNVMGKQVPDLTENAKVHKQFSTDERPMPQALLTTEKPAVPQVMFRPLSAPLVPGSQPPRPVISVVHSVPALAQSANEASRLVPEPSSPVTPSHVTHSYRNIIMGNHVTTCSSSYSQPQSPNSAVNPSYSYSQSQPPALCSPPNYFLTKSEKTDPISIGPGHSFGMIGHGSLANISSTSINRNPLVVNNMHSGSQWIDNSRMDNSRSINNDPPLHNDTRNLNNYNPMQNMSRDHFPVECTPDTSGSQNHSALTEAFPHLDIINDLLDDEYGVELTSNASSSVQNFINEPHHLNRQLTFPRDIRMGGGSGPSISSCRLERSHSYRDNEFRYNYNSAGQFHPNLNPQANNLHLYPNIQVDGLLPNQWQMAGTNLSYSNMRSLEDDGLSYNFPNYPNLSCGVNGYTMFRPSNGH